MNFRTDVQTKLKNILTTWTVQLTEWANPVVHLVLVNCSVGYRFVSEIVGFQEAIICVQLRDFKRQSSVAKAGTLIRIRT